MHFPVLWCVENMYGSDRFSMALERPFRLYMPQTSVVSSAKPVLVRSELDDLAYTQGIAQASTTDHPNDNRAEFLVSSEMRDFGSSFSSYPTVVPNTMFMVPPSISVPVPPSASEDPHARQSEMPADCDVNVYDEERKMDREHRKRSKNWTRPETLRLIQAWANLDTKFGRAGKKSELWDQIADLLRKDGFSRDAQQCKDKWEKLSANYKEVHEGTKVRDEFFYYEDIHSLMLARSKKRERDADDALLKGRFDATRVEDVDLDSSGDFGLRLDESLHFPRMNTEQLVEAHPSYVACEDSGGKNALKYMDLKDVQDLMDACLAKQRRFFAGLLEEIERKEQLKERLRQEKEDRWRAEDREQRLAFTNAMIILTQRLLGETSNMEHTQSINSSDNTSDEQQGFKKRLKLWKRNEVLQLIKIRTEMESKFNGSTTKTDLWVELAETLSMQNIHRDGRQCRDKWEELMAEYKDVVEGRSNPRGSPFFTELKTFVEESHFAP